MKHIRSKWYSNEKKNLMDSERDSMEKNKDRQKQLGKVVGMVASRVYMRKRHQDVVKEKKEKNFYSWE